MPTINQLASIDEVSGGNQIPTYYSGGGDARKMSVNLLQEYLQDNLDFPDNASEVTYNPAGTSAVARTVESKLRESVSVKDFGAKGDGVTDDTTAIQNAIDSCINTQKKLYLPVGVYKITSPLIIGKFSASAWSYASFSMEGEKTPWVAEGTYIKSTTIVPTFKDTFAIGIQNGRSVSIKGISLIGLNTFGIGSGLTAPKYPEMMTNSTFVNNSVRDSRYSPYSGICIDPFGTSVPADSGYPGLSSRYVATAAGSSFVILDEVSCQNFTVGVMITPNGITQNAENIHMENCKFDFNKVGLAIGQSQSRNVTVRNSDMAFNLYGVDGNNYGLQQGSSPKIYNANMSGKYLFNVGSRWGSPLFASGVHAESFASIGFLGNANATAADPAVFIGCSFSFSDFGGIFPDTHLMTYTPTTFNSCQFLNTGMTNVFPLRLHRIRNPDDLLSFKNCFFGEAVQSEFFVAPSSENDAFVFSNSAFSDCVFGDGSSRGPSAGSAPFSHQSTMYQASDLNKATVPYGSIIRFLSETATIIKFVGGADNSVSLGSVTVTTGSSGTATFTVADGTIVRAGDLIYTSTAGNYANPAGSTISLSSLCIGIVTNVATNTITISGVPQSLATGTFSLTKRWWPRFHAASTGDVTSGSTTIANVTPTAAWANGNAIQGTGIPAGAYIVSGGGTASLVISKAATATNSGTRLFDANVNSITGTAV